MSLTTISIDVAGLNEVGKKFHERPQKVSKAMGDAIEEAAHIAADESKKAITTGWTRAIDTGRLRSELVPRMIDRRMFRATIYPVVEYGVYVHEGTWKMRARPFFQVAKSTAAPKVKEAFERHIRKALN